MPGTYAPPAVELPKTSAIVGMPAGRRPREVAEQRAAGDEDLLLGRQVGAAGLDQGDRRQPVLRGDLRGPQGFFSVHGLLRAALDGRVVGGDQALDALDHADAGDQRGADRGSREPQPASGDSSRNGESSSRSSSMRSRGSSLPRAWCRSTYFSPPPATALACSASSSASFGEHRLAVRACSAPRRVQRRTVGRSQEGLRDVHVPRAQPLAEALGLRVEPGRGGDALARAARGRRRSRRRGWAARAPRPRGPGSPAAAPGRSRA